MTVVSWLHISDFHLKAVSSHPYEADIVLKALLNEVANPSSSVSHFDFLFVTGDLSFGGKVGDFELVSKFFDDLRKATGIGKERTFVVPGNHDIDRNEITGIVKAAERGLMDSKTVLDFFVGKPEDRRFVLRRLDNFARFENTYFEGNLCFCDKHIYFTKKFKIDKKRIAVLGLNSAWLCHGGKRDHKHILVGEPQVIDALNQASDCDLKIALLHHPFSLLKKFDSDLIKRWIKAECDFVLLGHMHHPSAVFKQDKFGQNLFITSGPSYLNRKYPNGYNYVRLDLSSCKGEINFFKYHDSNHKFSLRKTTEFDLSKEIFLNKMKFDRLEL